MSKLTEHYRHLLGLDASWEVSDVSLSLEEKQARKRQERMNLMVDDPQKWLRKAERLVSERGTDNYESAAEILDELREALADKGGKRITHRHAAHLAQKYPTLNRMKSSLRKRGLLE